MAFAKQYFSSYKSNNNLDYYLEIWVDGYTGGNPTEIKLGAGGPVISYDTDQEDRFSPILSSQCELPFMVTGISTESFITLLRTTYQEKQVYLHLYRATSSTYTSTKPLWSGFLVMDLGSGEDVAFPYEQKLRFVDGLSLLKDIDFVDLSKSGSETNIQGSYTQDNMYYGPAIYTFWIKEILKKIGSATTTQGVSINYGFTTAVNWYNADMQNTNQGSDPLGLTQCVVSMFHNKNEQDVFTPENCYTVLKEILRHWGARITYWKHEFWIVQIPEYITTESGFIDNPDNINSRQYDLSGSLISSQDHLGDTFYTRYEQTIQSNQVSKIVGTKYDYLPIIHNVEADFLSFASQNYYGGFPYGVNAENQEIFQGTIIDASTANFLWLSIPLNWVWDMSGTSLPNGHTNGWWSYVKFNFYASDGTTTYYLQYDSSNDSYYWVIEADWIPLGNTSPKYIIKSRNITETNYIGFEEQIPFVDSSGNAIAMSGAWSFFLDIEKFGTNSSNVGSFYCRFSGYPPSSYYSYVKADPTSIYPTLPNPSGSGTTFSGKVSWSNTLQNPSGIVATSFSTPAGFDAGTSQADIQLITSSPFKGFLQTLSTTQSATFGISLNTQIDNSTNTEAYNFGTLLWGDAFEQFAIGCLRVNNGNTFVKTNPDGEWGRGILTGQKTFTELLINEFLTGQIEVVITPTMRLAVGDQNKNQTASASGGGTAERPRYVNPIGILRETRNGVDPVYFFKRGSFHSLYDEWDYEGYQILRDSVTSTTTSNDIGGLGGSQDNNPVSAAKIIGNVTDALMMNSPIAYLRTTVQATGANVVVNGNFNVATGWVLGTGWSIDTTASKAKFAATGSLSSLSQINLTEGTKYQIIFTIDITAGQLSVKAGTSGGSQVITVSGQYEIYLLCGGSTSIEFQAGTTFTGSISQVSIAEQKSLSSVPIESLGEAVFKTNDTLNLVNSIGGDIIPLNVTSNQGATDTAISVTAVPLFDDIGSNSVLLINQDDLSAQYQNKTKGTVAGFGIDADGISKGGIEITGWLNSDTMSGAAVTNVPTALSVKNYVDGQVGASDTLAEVLANGNTTGGTNISVNDNDKITFGQLPDLEIYHDTNNSYIKDVGNGNLILQATDFVLKSGGTGSYIETSGGATKLYYSNSLKLATTSTGISITGGGVFTGQVTIPATPVASTDAASKSYVDAQVSATDSLQEVTTVGNTTTNSIMIGSSSSPLAKLHTLTGSSGVSSVDGGTSAIIESNTTNYLRFLNPNAAIGGLVWTSPSDNFGAFLRWGHSSGLLEIATANSNDSITFATGNASEKMRLTSGGNLLLGTTSDNGEKLVVNGDIKLLNTANKIKFGGSGTTATWSAPQIARISGFMTMSDFSGVQLGGYDGTSYGPRFTVYGSGAIGFNNNYGTSGQVLKSNGNTYPTWVDASSVIGGPYLPLTAGSSKQLTDALWLGGTTDSTRKIFFTNSGSYAKGFFDAGAYGFQVVGSEKMTLTSTGLGIGTTSVSYPLHVVTNSSSYAAYFKNSNSNGGGVVIAAANGGGGTNPILDLRDSTDNVKVRVIESGNVGIGTSSPISKTEIKSSGANGLVLSEDLNNSSLSSRLFLTNGTSGQGITFLNASGNLQFLTGSIPNNTSGSEKMRLTSGGNFGIGTSSPSDIFEVKGSAATPPSVAISLTGNDARIKFTETFSTGTSWLMGIQASSDKFVIANSGSSLGTNQRLTIDSAGNTTLTGSLIGTIGTFNSYINSIGVIQVNSATFVDSTRRNIYLNSFAAGGGAGIFFRDGFTYNASITAEDHSGSSADGICISGYDGVSISTGSNARNERFRVAQSGNILINTTTDDGSSKLQVSSGGSDIPTIKASYNSTNYLELAHNRINAVASGGNDSISFQTAGTTKAFLNQSGNFIINSTSDNGQKLQVTGNIRITGGFQASNTGGFLLADTGGSMRYGLKYGAAGAVGATNLMMLTNRSLSSATGGGEVAIAANASTTGVTETEVMRIKANTQSQVSIDGVLSLTSQNTPADPPNRASTIWLDSNFDLKIKITNNSGVTVTKTLAEYA